MRRTPGGWRTALRIATREARRARGRTALVLAMIALPVFALSFAAATYDMLQLTPAEALAQQIGMADAELQWISDDPIRQFPAGGYTSDGAARSDPPSDADILALLPPGSRVIPVSLDLWSRLSTAGKTDEVRTYSLDIADPLTRGMVHLLEGRAPVDDTEAAVSPQLLRRFGAGIGSKIIIGADSGDREYTVVAVVEITKTLREVVILPPEGWPWPIVNWLVDTPDPVSWAQVRELNRHGILATSRAVTLNPPPADELSGELASGSADMTGLSIIALVAGLGTLEVVLLVGPALAVSARQRRRDLALVAAAGGAPAHLRRIVLADGVVLGAGGAVIGIMLGIVAAIAGRPLLEGWLFEHRLGGYRVNPPWLLAIAGLAVVTGALAALAPAYSAARQDVVASLTGRRGIVRPRRRWPVIGLALTTAGTGLTGYGAWRTTTVLILGGLAMAEFGLVLCTPALIGLLARLGPQLPLAPRIALRDIARNRTAAAPAISAVMAAVASSVAIGCYLASEQARTLDTWQPLVPPGSVTVYQDATDQEIDPLAIRPLATAAGLSITGLAELRQPTCPAGGSTDAYCGLRLRLPAELRCPVPWSMQPDQAAQRRALADERCLQPIRRHYSGHQQSLVDDGTALPILTSARSDDLDRARATLAAGGMVITDPRYVVHGKVTVEIDRGAGLDPADLETVILPAYVLRTGRDAPWEIYSPAALARTGLISSQWAVLLSTSTMPGTAQQKAFTSALREHLPDQSTWVDVERGPPGSANNVTLLVLAIAAGLITLGAAGIATGLAAVAGRAELSMLAAVGASPRLRRALSLSQAGLIAGLGSLLGIAAGLVAAFAILVAINQGYARTWPVMVPYPIMISWRTLGVVAVVPLVAMLGAGLLARSRLPVERRTG